jgi:2-(1,2-epoxy-1,2-dihydrophenyl)acetyl-CoA isomerase
MRGSTARGARECYDRSMSDVRIERLGRTTLVTIERPEARNALTREVNRALVAAFDEAAADPEVRVILLTGAGGHFCAGADLKKNVQDNPNFLEMLGDFLDEYHSVIRAIFRCPKPTMAVIDGAAVGFGADLAFACDLRIASEAAYVQERFVKIGLMPDGGGTFWLPRLVGTARAMQMILMAEKIDAARMKELGLALDIVPSLRLRDAALAVARSLEAGPPLAYAAIKQALYASWGSLEDALLREREGQLKLLRSEDAMEGVMAWMGRRDPVFQGK